MKEVRITGASVELDDVPESECEKLAMLKHGLMPLLYAFEGKQITIIIELTPTKH